LISSRNVSSALSIRYISDDLRGIGFIIQSPELILIL
jgi:hypothetical protein